MPDTLRVDELPEFAALVKHREDFGPTHLRDLGFVDVGASGGVWGLQNGYALMAGGAAEDIAVVRPVFEALKPTGPYGYVHAGKVGAGHFAKMVHNGIEYANDAGLRRGLGVAGEGRLRRGCA